MCNYLLQCIGLWKSDRRRAVGSVASVMGWIDSEERTLLRDRGLTEAGVSFQNKLHQCAFKKKKKEKKKVWPA